MSTCHHALKIFCFALNWIWWIFVSACKNYFDEDFVQNNRNHQSFMLERNKESFGIVEPNVFQIFHFGFVLSWIACLFVRTSYIPGNANWKKWLWKLKLGQHLATRNAQTIPKLYFNVVAWKAVDFCLFLGDRFFFLQ